MRICLLAVAFIACVGAFAEDAWRNDFNDVTGWEKQTTWQANPSPGATVTTTAGIAEFRTPEAAKGMKWLLQLEDPVDLEITPWLVIRYRAQALNKATDYLVYLRDGTHEGTKVIPASATKTDGQWHTVAVCLPERGVIEPVSGLALQASATANGPASLFVDYLAITDTPPTDAEGYSADPRPTREWQVDLGKPTAWTLQPSWLSNHSAAARVSVSKEGLLFAVPEGSRGAKWSLALPEAISGATWVALKYRARNLRSWGDYTLYVASQGGGKAAQEQYAIQQADIISDGEWHVALGRVSVPTITTLAMQVQSLREGGTLEIADLHFANGKPTVKLSDTFELTPGWPRDTFNFHSLPLPPANTRGEDLARRLGMEGWLPPGKATAYGIPFTIRDSNEAAVVTPIKQPGSITVELLGRPAEAYLLLTAQFPANDEPSYPGSGGLLTQPHRFVAQVQYADGSVDEQFPWSLNSAQHAISRGLHLYSVAIDPSRPPVRLTLVDRMSRGAFGLVALTLGDKPGPATAATAVKPASPLPREKPVAARAAGIKRRDNLLAIDAFTISMALDLSQGLRVSSLTNHSGVGLTSSFKPGPLFRVLGEGFEVNSEQFAVDRLTQEASGYRIDLTCTRVKPALKVSVWVDVTEPAEIGLRARLDTGGRDRTKTRFLFPEVSGVTLGGSLSDLSVWSPRRGDVITNELVSLREPYAGAGNPFQIVGAFDPRQGTGLYLMTEDLTGIARFYQVQKSPEGARLAVEYSPTTDGDLPRTLLGFNQGDWHAQLERYRKWVGTWYKPAAPRKQWFYDIFSFRQQFLHFALPKKSGMFDPDTRTFHLQDALAKDEQAFGEVDYLHLFDWGWDPVHGRCGDYLPWDYLGGADNFRRAVAGVQATKPVGLYIEGILMEPTSNIGKAHGAEWQMLDSQLKPYPHFAPSLNMCSWVKPWQDYLSDTYQRVQRETGAKGYYIDEYGFQDYNRSCYSSAHGHPVPSTPVGGELQMTRLIRQKLGPEAAIYTEESPTDVTSQFQDGSFTYNISSVPDVWSPTHVNLYRFAFPHFKTIEIITCDRPLGSNVEAVRRILFNGEAIWIEGDPQAWFSRPVREQIQLNHRVMRANRQCFSSLHVEALVPTLIEGVYANRFSERPDLLGKTCWTVYNTNQRTLRGEVIAVEHAPGAQYLDEITGKPLKTRVAGKTAYVTLDLAPRDVAVISRGLYVK